METRWDVAFGRLVVAQGLVPQDTLRAVYQALPPGRSLKDELVARGLLAADRAAALEAWLQAQAPGPPVPAAEAVTVLAPPGPAPPADDLTALAPGPAGPGDDSATVQHGGPASSPRRAARLPEVGQTVGGRYELVGLLGKGGMGAVFRARDAAPGGGPCAVKVLLPSGSGDALARFRREAQALARVDAHAGVVRVRALGEHEGLTYAAMDLVEGQDLHGLVEDEGPLEVERALRYTEAVARAVHHCHERGVLHRDLKPANVLLRAADDAPLVLDFGIALDREAERLTRTGDVLGTPAYMAPEQADGDKEAIDARTDVYALGATLYELVTGRPPFTGPQVVILKQVLLDAPPPIASLRPRVPEALEVVCARAMAKDREQRYPSAAAFADELARLRRGEPIEARAPTWGEDLAWRWRRRDPRLVRRVVAALVLALGLPLALLARNVAARKDRAEVVAAVTSSLAGLGRALDADAWPLPGASTTGSTVLEHAQVIRSGLAELDGQAAPEDPRQPDAGALAALARRLEAAGDPLARELGAGLGDRLPAAGAALVRLARRRAIEQGAARWPEGTAPPDDAADPEARLVRGLHALAWGRDERLTPSQALAARGALEALRGGPGVVAAVVSDVLARRAALAATLRNGSDDLVERLRASLEAGDAIGVRPPDEWRASEAGGPDAAWLRAERPLLGVERAIEGAARVLPPRGELWTRRAPYDALAKYLRIVLAELGEPTPVSVAQLGPAVSRLIYAVGARARESGLSADEGAGFPALVSPDLIPYLVELPEDPDAANDAADCLHTGVGAEHQAAELGDSSSFSPERIVASLRLGLPPRIRGYKLEAARLLEDLDPVVARCRVGEAYLARARLLEEAEPPRHLRGSETVEQRHAREAETYARAAEDLAAALGDELPPGLRRRLEVGPPPTQLLAAVLPLWRATVSGSLARVVLRREEIRADLGQPGRPAPEAVRAALELVDALAPRQAELHGGDHSELLRQVALLVSKLLLSPRPMDPALRGWLAPQELPRWGAALDASWRTLERAIAMRSAPPPGRLTLAAVRDAYDLDRELRAGPSEVAAKLARLLASRGRAAEAVDQLEATLRRVEGLDLEPPLALRVGLADALEQAGRAERAVEVARDVRARADRGLPGAFVAKQGAWLREARSCARAVEARVRLAQGDVDGARRLKDEALADGDPTTTGEAGAFWSQVLPRLD